jgi:hypothetical protein
MSIIKLAATVDEDRHLLALVPPSIPPGPVTVLVLPASQEDEETELWTAGIAEEWADDLGDPSQDIYTLADGEPVGES